MDLKSMLEQRFTEEAKKRGHACPGNIPIGDKYHFAGKIEKIIKEELKEWFKSRKA